MATELDWKAAGLPDYEAMSRCSLLAFRDVDGKCDACGKELTGRQVRWCSADCRDVFPTNHYWTWARWAAVERDGHACVRCGRSWQGLLVAARITGYRPQGELPWTEAYLWQEREREFQEALKALRLEVNHKQPVRGYRASGCHHHLDGLETLCHRCHAEETRLQIVSVRTVGGSRTIACWERQCDRCWANEKGCWCEHHRGLPVPPLQEPTEQMVMELA